jgi:uncharacterized SAM-binding protein YcdF (DUF218 family)
MIRYRPTIQAITDLLFIETPLEKVDLMFVFGHAWGQTMIEVKRLYDEGISSRILISGRGPNRDQSESEAFRFYRKGLELGIPEHAFLLEEKATNTKENIEFSISIVENAIGLKKINKILFVCKGFHARRVLMTARKFFPKHIEYFFFPIVDERIIERDSWWRDPVAFERVMAEVGRIADYTLKGDLSIH